MGRAATDAYSTLSPSIGDVWRAVDDVHRPNRNSRQAFPFMLHCIMMRTHRSTSMNTRGKPRAALPPPRVRKEPPTIAEAMLAAEGLSSDPESQVEIAAGLMGVSEDEVRPFLPKPTLRAKVPSASIFAGTRAVVVERRPLRARLA